jgi:hypothetical protein
MPYYPKKKGDRLLFFQERGQFPLAVRAPDKVACRKNGKKWVQAPFSV